MKMTVKFFFALVLSTSMIYAQDLRSTMRNLSDSLRQVSSYAKSGNNGPMALEQIIRMKEAASESLNYLPRGISQSDTASVQKYNQVMSELVQKTIELEVIFGTSPLNKAEANRCLQEINDIRVKGHSLFR